MKGITIFTRKQSLGEEISNAVSHGVGAILSLIGMVILIILSIQSGSVSGLISSIFYGTALIILYSVSTIYHSLTHPTAKKVFQILDHCSIFLLISGTYAPISVVMMGGVTGYCLLAVNTTCAVVGIVLNAINIKKFKTVSMLLYVIMGWMCMFTLKSLIESTPPNTLWLLVTGGVAYTAGIIFYKMKKLKYMHFVWHLFVLLGSVLHYFFILLDCYIY